MVPNALAVLGRVYPEEGPKKNLVFSLYGAGAPSGFVFGSLLGALLGQLTWWPWAFWITSVVCMLLALSTYLTVPDLPSTRKHKGEMGELDPIGSLLAVAGLILANFAFNQAPIVSWVTPYTYVTLILGIALLIIFVLYERIAIHPLVPVKYFTFEATFTLVVVSAGFASFGIWEFYYYRFSEVLRGYSPLAVTAQNVPIIISGAAAAISSGYLLDRFGSSFVLLYSMTAFALALVLLAISPVKETYWARTFVSMIIVPWGVVSNSVVLSPP